MHGGRGQPVVKPVSTACREILYKHADNLSVREFKTHPSVTVPIVTSAVNNTL